MLSEPAYLHGHGLIDPELARMLAADGTWQALLTEALNLAEELGLIAHDEGAADDGDGDVDVDGDRAATGTVNDIAPQPESESEPAAGVDEEPEGQTDGEKSAHTHADPPGPEASPPPPPSRFCVRSFLARGSRRKAGYLPEFGTSTPSRLGTALPPAPVSIGTIADAILAATNADPTLARPEHPDGHGGLTSPPGGALTYRPDAATTALVHARDGHCRFPGCTRPAAGCQLDHIIEYLAHDPLSGGWTIATNLHCLCQFHHQLNTLGLWSVTVLPGHTLRWTSRTGTTAITLPAGAHGSHTLHTPTPRITGRRGGNTPSPPQTRPADPPPF
ncbi:HNH endonuclease signature motif containing protein [Rhodococcus sp. NPDC055112]